MQKKQSSKSKPKNSSIAKQRTRKRFVVVLLCLNAAVWSLFAWVNGEKREVAEEKIKQEQQEKAVAVPGQYLPIYLAAEKEYGVPWYVLAAHHRVETIFSTMDPMLSPAGAEGHLQFMPCTFVGWKHPSCKGLGKGSIPEHDKTNPAIIRKYGGYGVDANGDGLADPFDAEDAIFSAAHYLSKNGAADGNYKKAAYTYNHSQEYVSQIVHYAEKYKKSGPDPTALK